MSPEGNSASSAPVSGSSSSSTRTPAGTTDAVRVSVSTTTGRESASTNRIRSAGYPGSIGTYPAPACTTASIATTASSERGSTTPTRHSGPTPRASNRRASRFTRSVSSRYDSDSPAHTTAVASARDCARAWNNSANVPGAAARLVPCQVVSNRSRSARSSTSIRSTACPGSSATACNARTNRSRTDRA